MQPPLIIRHLGSTDFKATCHAMQQFTASRTENTPDELWLTEHPPVYSLGLNRKQVRLPERTDIPLVHTDRGGKITYHGPGQVVLYVLLDMQRHHLTIRSLVTMLENTVIDLLGKYGVEASAQTNAPGVYVKNAKIASLGLRIKNNCCYHGLSLNVDMDLSPFAAIDPCGYVGLEVTQMKDLGINENTNQIGELLLQILAATLENKHHD